jgi:tetratricopeptide (TPR) repeat protein
MPIISSIFLVLSLILAVVIGPQTRPWVWGPAMIALGIAVLAAIPAIWRRGKISTDLGMLAFGAVTAAWFAWRAWVSPVAELGQADLLLVAGAVGTFISIRVIAGHELAERILSWGIALLLLANLAVMGIQMIHPDFVPVYRSKLVKIPTGFFAHYNETANYLIGSSMLVGAAALFGRHALATRVFWFLIAIAGIAGVWFTRSRGGIFGAAAACGVFALFLLILGKRRNAKWFAPAVIAVPAIGVGIVAYLLIGWQEAQDFRQAGSGLDALMDNACRLYFLGIALSCIGLHPLIGGGSRSFSWECFRFWDHMAQGPSGARPELVHNELVQSATDYGLIGAGLLVGLLGALALVAILRVLFEEPSSNRDDRDAWRIGALTALAGMLVQSSFSFVFHLMTGILLLGICLGHMSRTPAQSPTLRTLASRILLSAAALACAALLLPLGWKGLQVTRILWPVYFSKQLDISAESKIDALNAAIRIWPQPTLYLERGITFQELTAFKDQSYFHDFAERAIADYRSASQLHPFDPKFEINRANLLSQLQRDAEAEESFARTIALQGGMEPTFRGHFFLARHFLHKGLRATHSGISKEALAAFEEAARSMEEAVRVTPGYVIGIEGRNIRITIHERLGNARESAGDLPGALKAYDFAASIPTGNRAHYRAAVIIGKMAVEAWSERKPSEALFGFMEAKKRIGLAGNTLPESVTPAQRAATIAYLDQQIAFLKGAKIEPTKPKK